MNAKRKKTYLVLLAVGAGALLLDRLILSGATAPEEALAEDATAEISQVHPQGTGVRRAPAKNPLKKQVGAEKPASVAIPALPFPRSLVPTESGAPFRDIFARDGGREESTDRQAAGRASAAPAEGGPLTSASFLRAHRLDAIFSDDGLGIAVIDGALARTGDELSGCKLVKIEGTNAHFECSDGPAILGLHEANEHSQR